MPKRQRDHVGNLESLFLRLEELVLANSGEDEFEEIFKLLIAKLWDERSGRQKRFSVEPNHRDTAQGIETLLVEAKKAWPGILGPSETTRRTPEHLSTWVDV